MLGQARVFIRSRRRIIIEANDVSGIKANAQGTRSAGTGRVRAIIFDIDGVLADSREAVVHNTCGLLREYGFAVRREEVEKMSSAHSAETVLVALAPSLAGKRELLRRMLARLAKLTRENLHLVRPTALAGKIPEFAKKYRLAAASNRKSSARMVLEKLGIERHFSAVATSADAPPKPDPKMILLALERLEIGADEAVFVGDNEEDMLAGKAAGTRTFKLDGNDKKACERFVMAFL